MEATSVDAYAHAQEAWAGCVFCGWWLEPGTGLVVVERYPSGSVVTGPWCGSCVAQDPRIKRPVRSGGSVSKSGLVR
jgi:hypothetical protein